MDETEKGGGWQTPERNSPNWITFFCKWVSWLCLYCCFILWTTVNMHTLRYFNYLAHIETPVCLWWKNFAVKEVVASSPDHNEKLNFLRGILQRSWPESWQGSTLCVDLVRNLDWDSLQGFLVGIMIEIPEGNLTSLWESCQKFQQVSSLNIPAIFLNLFFTR